MTHEIYSNHIGSASELLLAVDIKEGFVPFRETLTYASRLRKFLTLVSVPRARSFDGADRGLFITPIDRLRTLHMVRWTLFDDDKRLLLAVTFDHPIGPYIRRIVDEGGPLLDTILCHAKGYEESSTDLGYAGFLKFAQDHQIEADFFTGTFPQLTTDDLSYLMGLEQLQHDNPPDDVANTTYRLKSPGERAHEAQQDPAKRPKYEQQALRLLRAVHYASKFFPEPDVVDPVGGPAANSRDHLFYKGFARFLLEQVDLANLSNPADAAAFRGVRAWFGPPPSPSERPALTARPPQKLLTTGANVQGGIVKAYKTKSADPSAAKPMNTAAMLLLRFENSQKGGAFLKAIASHITSHSNAADAAVRMNIALSHRGLKTLSTPEAVRRDFPVDFREGAAARGGMIGDFGTNAPELWNPRRHDATGGDAGPMDLETIDAVITLQARVDKLGDEHLGWTDAHPLCAHWKTMPQDGVTVLAVERMTRHEDSQGRMVGHFGFIDGISNPIVTETRGDDLHYAPLGSVVLGYGNDESLPTPDLLRDGSFMVVRKMSQNVEAFRKIDADVQERIVGRRLNGDPLIGGSGVNGFTYASDPDGAQCPFASHARRVNPREKRGTNPKTGEVIHDDTTRITRRGFSYGPRVEDDPDADRGLMFVCYNASIGEQFEVIQRWIGAGNSTGIYSGRNDALLGPVAVDEKRMFRYLDGATGKVERKDLGATPFVTLKWGMYFFVPSLSAVKKIASWAVGGAAADNAKADAEKTLAKRGEEIIATLKSEDDWKALLEGGDPRNRDKADAVTAYINAAHDGAVRIPLDDRAWPDGNPGFVLVTDPSKVMGVFNDTKNFSNRVYWNRMKDVIGPVYLGMDPVPQPLSKITNSQDDIEFERETVGVYKAETTDVNPFLGFTTFSEDARKVVFAEALKAVRGGLMSPGLPDEPDPDVPRGRRKLIDMEELIGGSVATFGLKWLGLPGDWLRQAAAAGAPFTPATNDEVITIYPHLVSPNSNGSDQPGAPAPRGTPEAPDDFLEMASYFFGPWPQDDATARATYKGKALTDRVVAWLKGRKNEGQLPAETLIGHLQRKPTGWSEEDIVRLALNSAIGLHAPTCASFAGVAYDWLSEGTFWRLQQDLLDAAGGGAPDLAMATKILRDPIIASMSNYAGPKHLHRVCTSRSVAIGGEAVKGGDKVVLALGSAAQRCTHLIDKEQVLFGGLYGQREQPIHACPGRDLAMTLMMATIAGLMLTGQVVRNSALTAYVRMP